MLEAGQDGFADRARDVLISWFPALVCFVLIPLAIYLPNQREYDYEPTVILPFLGAAAFSLLLLSGLGLIRSPLRTRIAVTLFFFGAFIALSDILAPAPLTLLEDYSALDRLEEPLRLTLIQLALAIVLLICLWKLPLGIVRDVAFLLVMGVLLAEGVTVAAKLSWRTDFPSPGTASRSIAPKVVGKPEPAGTGNIYQLVFDAYSGCTFLKTARRLNCEAGFEGFTFFREARSSYIYTPLSYANFMTGTLFDGRSLEEWQEAAVDSGLVEKLYRSGYTVWFYPVGLRYVHKRASHVRYPDEKEWLNTNFLRVCLVRTIPNPLRQEANTILRNMGAERRNAEEPPSAGDARDASSESSALGLGRCCPAMEDFLREEAMRPARGQYVYFHVMIPHAPLQWDCACNPSAHATYEENACCATNLMMQFIRRLKELGRFEDSLIILQSDHGWELSGDDCSAAGGGEVPPEVARTITDSTNDVMTPKHFLDRTYPLLLIKPPHAEDLPLRISSAPAQLSDLPATICDLASISGGFPNGRNVFSLGEHDSRERHFFAGYKRAGKNKGVLVLGKHVLSGKLGHFSYAEGSGWTVYPNMPVRYGKGWFSH